MSNRPVRIELAPSGRSLAEHVELTRLAAKHGWEGVWLSEVNGMDAATQAAVTGEAIAAGRVGTAIVPMQTRDPLLMAMTAATLNQHLDGRFVLGLGTSTRIIIEDWHATDWGSPLALTREYVSLFRRFMAGERVTTGSGRYRYKNASLGVRSPRNVPVYLAALNDRMLELAGEIGDGVILNFASLEYLQHARERIAAGAERANRSAGDVEVVIFFRCSITSDFGEVRERHQRELLTYLMAPVYQKMFGREGYGELCAEVEQFWRSGKREDALAAIPDQFLLDRVLSGGPSEVALSLQGYTDAGMDAAIVMPVPPPSSADYLSAARHIVTTLGDEVAAFQKRAELKEVQ